MEARSARQSAPRWGRERGRGRSHQTAGDRCEHRMPPRVLQHIEGHPGDMEAPPGRTGPSIRQDPGPNQNVAQIRRLEPCRGTGPPDAGRGRVTGASRGNGSGAVQGDSAISRRQAQAEIWRVRDILETAGHGHSNAEQGSGPGDRDQVLETRGAQGPRRARVQGLWSRATGPRRRSGGWLLGRSRRKNQRTGRCLQQAGKTAD